MNALLQIWAYCVNCWDRTQQVWMRDEGIFEVYLCENCKCEHKVAVR
jgi:hypothetical protein